MTPKKTIRPAVMFINKIFMRVLAWLVCCFCIGSVMIVSVFAYLLTGKDLVWLVISTIDAANDIQKDINSWK